MWDKVVIQATPILILTDKILIINELISVNPSTPSPYTLIIYIIRE
jgi:hypothetical protein